MKFVIDAGHGHNTAGKRCLKSLDSNETREWDLNQRIATEVVRLLQASGQKVKRADDTSGKIDISLQSRCDTANNWDADAYISIHHDSGVQGGSGGGATVFTYTSVSAKTKELAKNVYDAYIAAGGIKGNRSEPIQTANFYVLRKTSMPAILIECGFMDSKADVPIILSDTFPAKAALGIAKGIAATFGFQISDQEHADGAQEDSAAPHWAQACLDSLVEKGIITDASQWDDFNASLSTLTVGQLIALIDKATN